MQSAPLVSRNSMAAAAFYLIIKVTWEKMAFQLHLFSNL